MKKLTVSTLAIAVILILFTLALALPAVAQAPGDANEDGVISAGDITKLERIILGWDAETPGADANLDGTVNASDIGVVEYMILGIWPWNHVQIVAPDNLPYCTHFTATVFVTHLDNFGSASYLIEFDDLVLELEGVTNGSLLQVGPGKTSKFYTVNAADWADLGGAVIINNSIDGNPGVSGAGYLAKVHFHVIGSQGESSTMLFFPPLSNLSDRWGAAIDATWAGDIVNVSAGGPTATPTATATATATATPTATATGTATPSPSPTLTVTPPPTPDWLCVNEFPICTNPSSPDICPAVSGDTVVWLDGDSCIHVYDLYSSTEFPICNNGSYKYGPDVSGDIVVWEAQLNGSRDIYAYNLSSSSGAPICNNSSGQYNPMVSGDIVVWEDNRDYATNGYDIYGYDLSSETEFPVCTNSSAQYKPDVSGDIVVWYDNRNGNYDIYGYNLSSSAEFTVCNNSSDQYHPAISGGIVVWYDNRNGDRDIYGYDLSSGSEFPICTASADQQYPVISGDIVVWHDKRHGNGSIYGYNLSASYEFPICTNPFEQNSPDVSGDVVVWADFRNAGEFPNVDIYGATLHCSDPTPTPSPTPTPTATATATATATPTPTPSPTLLPCGYANFSSTDGGWVFEPCECDYYQDICCDGCAIDLLAQAELGYEFTQWECHFKYGGGFCINCSIDDIYAADTTLFFKTGCIHEVTAQFAPIATPTATSTATPTTTPTPQPELMGTEWWLWQVYYNTTSWGGEVNTVYHIANVRAVNATANVTYDAVGEDDSKEMTEATPPERGFTNYNAPGAAVIDWSVDQSGTEQEPVRERIVYTGLSGLFIPAIWFETLLDREIYVKGNDSTCWIDADSLSRRFGTTIGEDDGDIPKDILYSYQDDSVPANSSAPPGPQDGYPFSVGEDDWKQWEWIFKDQQYLYHTDTVHERGFRWNVSSTVDDYDVGANCEAPAAVGTYDVILLNVTNNYFRTYAEYGDNCSGDGDTTNIWWNDSVKHFVRKLDRITYVGREDWGIVDYETRDVSATINDFSDAGTGFDINVTVTNNEGSACNFSVLALIFDMDAITDDSWSDGSPYPGGETVYPDMSSWASISGAIQHTGALGSGNSTVLTWSNVGSSGTNTYKLWCNGGTATIN